MYHSDQLQHVESDGIQNYQIGANTFSDDANKSITEQQQTNETRIESTYIDQSGCFNDRM